MSEEMSVIHRQHTEMYTSLKQNFYEMLVAMKCWRQYRSQFRALTVDIFFPRIIASFFRVKQIKCWPIRGSCSVVANYLSC